MAMIWTYATWVPTVRNSHVHRLCSYEVVNCTTALTAIWHFLNLLFMRNTLKRVQSTNKEMFKPTSGCKQENGVWNSFDFDASTDKSRRKVEGCVGAIKGKNATNLVNHLKSKYKDIPSSAAEEKTNQPPLKIQTSGARYVSPFISCSCHCSQHCW
jgi:hypothetical protein